MKAASALACARGADVTLAEPQREVACACTRGAAGTELRCDCGSLLARRVEGGVEVKCRRCKRTVVLPLADA